MTTVTKNKKKLLLKIILRGHSQNIRKTKRVYVTKYLQFSVGHRHQREFRIDLSHVPICRIIFLNVQYSFFFIGVDVGFYMHASDCNSVFKCVINLPTRMDFSSSMFYEALALLLPVLLSRFLVFSLFFLFLFLLYISAQKYASIG